MRKRAIVAVARATYPVRQGGSRLKGGCRRTNQRIELHGRGPDYGSDRHPRLRSDRLQAETLRSILAKLRLGV